MADTTVSEPPVRGVSVEALVHSRWSPTCVCRRRDVLDDALVIPNATAILGLIVELLGDETRRRGAFVLMTRVFSEIDTERKWGDLPNAEAASRTGRRPSLATSTATIALYASTTLQGTTQVRTSATGGSPGVVIASELGPLDTYQYSLRRRIQRYQLAIRPEGHRLPGRRSSRRSPRLRVHTCKNVSLISM